MVIILGQLWDGLHIGRGSAKGSHAIAKGKNHGKMIIAPVIIVFTDAIEASKCLLSQKILSSS